VQALKSGRQPELEKPYEHGAEIDLGLPALLPADYIPDVHTRLVQYKRIASAPDPEALRELQVEMIDRFGLLPEPAKILFELTDLKLEVQPLGIRKIEAGPGGGRFIFGSEPRIDPARLVQLIQSRPKEFAFGSGGESLRFTRDLLNPETRVAQVRKVLGALTA
jgi:transcription-repair coupling factor (superfamily II helicase)